MEKFDPKQYTSKDLKKQIKYLNLLADRFPDVQSASTEIINLEAILNLPKGTEHFLSDIHGEYETFSHVLANASGVVKRKIDDVFGKTLRKRKKKLLGNINILSKRKARINSQK